MILKLHEVPVGVALCNRSPQSHFSTSAAAAATSPTNYFCHATRGVKLNNKFTGLQAITVDARGVGGAHTSRWQRDTSSADNETYNYHARAREVA